MRTEDDETITGCSKSICVFHSSNMAEIKEFKLTLHELTNVIHGLDMDLAKLNSAGHVRAGLIGVAITLIIGGATFIQGEINDLRSTYIAGKEKRMVLEGKVQAIADDLEEHKRRPHPH